MTLAEMLDLVEDKEGFRRILETLDVPAFAISNPTCVGEIRLRESLAEDDLRYLRTLTDRPIKVTLPGPYLLTRAMWVPEASRDAYADKEALGEKVVEILRDEVARLARAGADFIQLDEPVLTELVFTRATRTFMCASPRVRPAEGSVRAVADRARVWRRGGAHWPRMPGNRARRAHALAGSYARSPPVRARRFVSWCGVRHAAGERRAGGRQELGPASSIRAPTRSSAPKRSSRVARRCATFPPKPSSQS
jgi:hypothetical protein